MAANRVIRGPTLALVLLLKLIYNVTSSNMLFLRSFINGIVETLSFNYHIVYLILGNAILILSLPDAYTRNECYYDNYDSSPPGSS